MEQTPFIKFWDALNERLRAQRLPELLFGEAHLLWHQTIGHAQRAVMVTPERRAKSAA